MVRRSVTGNTSITYEPGSSITEARDLIGPLLKREDCDAATAPGENGYIHEVLVRVGHGTNG